MTLTHNRTIYSFYFAVFSTLVCNVVRTVYLLILKWHVSSKLKQVLPMQLRFDKRLVDKKHNGSFYHIATLFNLSTFVCIARYST